LGLVSINGLDMGLLGLTRLIRDPTSFINQKKKKKKKKGVALFAMKNRK
jgi:hypothetical protein